LTLAAIAGVIDVTPRPVFVLGPDAYYRYQNKAAGALLGYDPVEITQLHLTDLIETDAQWVMSGFDALRRQGHWSGSVLYRHRNSSLIKADVNVFRQALEDETALYVAFVHPFPRIGPKLAPVFATNSALGLGPEEVRLLHLLAESFSDDQIATLLNETALAVCEQVAEMLRKMDASSRTQAVIKAIKTRVVL